MTAVRRGSGAVLELAEDLYARVDRSLLTPAEGCGRHRPAHGSLRGAALRPGGRRAGRAQLRRARAQRGLPRRRPPRRRRHDRTPPRCTRSCRPRPGPTSRPRSPTCAPSRSADGSVPEPRDHASAAAHVGRIVAGIEALAPLLPHDADYLEALVKDFGRWADGGFEVPDFLDSLVAFQPGAAPRRRPASTSSSSRCTRRTATRTATSRPSCSRWSGPTWSPTSRRALRQPAVPADPLPGLHRRATTPTPPCSSPRPSRCARCRRFTLGRHLRRPRGRPLPPRRHRGRRRITRLDAAAGRRRGCSPTRSSPSSAFVLWDLVHDRTHSHGDLPFDPFMIKQRDAVLPVLAWRSCAATSPPSGRPSRSRPTGIPHARSVQYAVLFDRHVPLPDHRRPHPQLRRARRPAALRLAAPARRAALDRQPAHDRLGRVAEPVLELGRAVEELYWRSHRPARRRRTGSRPTSWSRRC